MLRKALFLDRDGVINHDPGDYTKSLEEFTVLPTVYEALKLAQDKGYLLVLITNQGGIAKGLYGHEQVHEIHDWFQVELAKHGITLTDIYYAPSHPDYGESLMRKPGSMMIERALAKHSISPTHSYIVGDKQRDLDSGSPLGVNGILIKTNDPLLPVVQQLP
ncbi:MAG: D-glycero-alpha-D-manno-heptose-1,7-bisphosphate 7-phosphatase [Flavobacteriales bacterium]